MKTLIRSDMKKYTKWEKDEAFERRVTSFHLEFGNKNHIRANEIWGELQPLYARAQKGKKTIELIGNLEHEIGVLLDIIRESDV